MLNTDISSQIFLGIVSIFSNFISGLSGGGAGLIQLPALLFFGLPFSKALATHKVASVALGLGASIPHLKRSNLQIKYVLLILTFGIPGVLLGSYTSSVLPGNISTTLLGILTLFLCFYSIRQKNLGCSNQIISINKLRVIDFGEFEDMDPYSPGKHVFFVGKLFSDEADQQTFINIFTVVFD